ncbi:MAG: hypothetical protein ACE5FG_07275 [Myxococcota bacterium]
MWIGLAAALALALAGPAEARSRSPHTDWHGHPLRIAAYILHPVGVLIDRGLFQPVARLASHEPIRTWVGMEPPVDETRAPQTENPFLKPYSED